MPYARARIQPCFLCDFRLIGFFLIFCFGIFSRVAGAMGICFPYLGEFQPTKYRENILCWMEMFWTIGIIALPGMYQYLNIYIPYAINSLNVCDNNMYN